MESMPTGVIKDWNSVLLGTGAIFVTDFREAWPPSVEMKLVTNASKSVEAT
jgi:hypothetical protein